MVDVGVEFVESKRQEYLARKTAIDIVKEARAKKAKDGEKNANKAGDEQEGGKKDEVAKPVGPEDTTHEAPKKSDERNKSQDNDQGDKASVEDDETDDDDTPTHDPIYCDGCSMSPIKGPRFKCVEYVSCPCKTPTLDLYFTQL